MTLQEKIDKVLREIPYDKIREDAFVALDKDKLIKGKGEDIGFLIMEQIDLFKVQYMKSVKSAIWDHCFRAIRKIMGHDIKKWYDKRFFEECLKENHEDIELGVAG